MKSKKSTLLIFTLIGFILGILFSPKKGKETREDIKDKVDKFRDDPKEAIDSAIRAAREKIDEIDMAIDDSIESMDDDIVIGKTFDIDGEDK